MSSLTCSSSSFLAAASVYGYSWALFPQLLTLLTSILLRHTTSAVCLCGARLNSNVMGTAEHLSLSYDHCLLMYFWRCTTTAVCLWRVRLKYNEKTATATELNSSSTLIVHQRHDLMWILHWQCNEVLWWPDVYTLMAQILKARYVMTGYNLAVPDLPFKEPGSSHSIQMIARWFLGTGGWKLASCNYLESSWICYHSSFRYLNNYSIYRFSSVQMSQYLFSLSGTVSPCIFPLFQPLFSFP